MYQYFAIADVNTSVLPDKDRVILEYLDDGNNHPQLVHIVAKYEYGWFISIQSENAEFNEMLRFAEKKGLSDQFTALMKSLRDYGFSYVRLDMEGLTDEIQSPPASMWEHMEAERVRAYGTGLPK